MAEKTNPDVIARSAGEDAISERNSPRIAACLPRCLTYRFEWSMLWCMNVSVECYAGYRGEETPRRFRFKRRGVEIVQVLDRWLAPDHRYFKVLGDDSGIYILRHDVDTWRWELTFFKQLADPDKRM